MKLSFNTISFRALQLIESFALAAINNQELSDFYLNEYNLYLKLSGWTDLEFDKELLNYVNNNWENNFN